MLDIQQFTKITSRSNRTRICLTYLITRVKCRDYAVERAVPPVPPVPTLPSVLPSQKPATTASPDAQADYVRVSATFRYIYQVWQQLSEPFSLSLSLAQHAVVLRVPIVTLSARERAEQSRSRLLVPVI